MALSIWLRRRWSASCGGPGMVAALINASLTVEAQRAKLIDEPAFAQLNKKERDSH